MRPSGLQRSQFAILGKLQRQGPLKLTDLARALYMERTTLTRNLRPLQRQGLVSIEPAPGEARSNQIKVTPLGLERYNAALVLWEKAQRRVLQTFGDENWRALETQLKTLRETVGGSE